MSKFLEGDLEVALDQLAQNKYKIIVEFVVSADSVEDAESEVNDIIQEGVLSLVSQDEERQPLYSYDVTDAEPTDLL